MKEIIIHGIPKQNYFAIAVPPTWLYKPIDGEGAVIRLQDPNTNHLTRVQIIETWLFEINDFVKMNGWSLLTYGLPAGKLAHVLRVKYPEIDQTELVRFVLLKKL